MAKKQADAQEQRRDVFDTLYNTMDRSVCPPRVIRGSYITKEQARSLGLTPKTEDREQK